MPAELETLEVPEVTTPDTGESDALDDAAGEGDEAPDSVPDSDDAPDTETDGEAADEEAAEGEQEPVSPDGRKMPDSLKKGLAALKAVAPDAAKELKGIYFANQEYRNAFPTVADATAAKTLIEEIGGPEGVQQIQSEREEWGTLDKQYAEGSKDFVTSIAESNPDAFLKTAPLVINEFAARAPEQYGFYKDSVSVNHFMAQPGVKDGIENLYKLHGQLAEAPWAQAAIASVINGVVGMQERAQQFSSKQQSVDPARQKLEQDKQTFEQQRRASFEEGVAKQAESYLTEKMKPEVERILAGRKIDAEAEQTIQSLVTQEVQKRLGEIPGFADKLEAFYRTGDSQKSIDYIKAQYKRLLPEATKKVVAPLYRNIQATAQVRPKPVSSGTQPVRSEVTLKEMPSWDQIDMEKTRQEYGDPTVAVMSGKAILKSGKKASGWI
jgi:hypothetical protein